MSEQMRRSMMIHGSLSVVFVTGGAIAALLTGGSGPLYFSVVYTTTLLLTAWGYERQLDRVDPARSNATPEKE